MDTLLAQKTDGDVRIPYDIQTPKSLKSKVGIFRNLFSEIIPEDILKGKEELNETEENVRKGLKKLRDFLTIHNLPSKTDDYFLMQFLRYQKFNFKKSEQKLKKYCLMRQEFMDFIESMDMHTVRNVLDTYVVGLLPYRDKHGRAIMFTRASTWCPEVLHADDVAKVFVTIIHFALTFPPTSVNGICYIGEGAFTSNYHLYPTFNAFRKFLPYQSNMPCRIQRVDVIKENVLCHYFYNALRPVLPLKISKRVHLHGNNLERLQQEYDPSILPNEFGGTMGPMNNDCFRDRFMDYVERFKAECAHFKVKSKK